MNALEGEGGLRVDGIRGSRARGRAWVLAIKARRTGMGIHSESVRTSLLASIGLQASFCTAGWVTPPLAWLGTYDSCSRGGQVHKRRTHGAGRCCSSSTWWYVVLTRQWPRLKAPPGAGAPTREAGRSGVSEVYQFMNSVCRTRRSCKAMVFTCLKRATLVGRLHSLSGHIVRA